MGGVPKKRGTKSKQGMRRSQKKLDAVKLLPCQNCKAPKLPHRVCENCGSYGAA